MPRAAGRMAPPPMKAGGWGRGRFRGPRTDGRDEDLGVDLRKLEIMNQDPGYSLFNSLCARGQNSRQRKDNVSAKTTGAGLSRQH